MYVRYDVCASKIDLPGDKHVRYIFILAKQRQVQQDFNRLGISSHNDDFGDATVECFGGLVGTLLGLLVVGGLLHEIEKCDGQICICHGEGFFGHDKNQKEGGTLLIGVGWSVL